MGWETRLSGRATPHATAPNGKSSQRRREGGLAGPESAAPDVRGDAKVMQNPGCRRKSLIDMERAKGFEPSTLTLAT